MNEELKIELGINEWLKLIKEDKNLNGAFISICQYIYLTEKENQELNKKYVNAVADYETTMSEKVELEKRLEEYQLQNIDLRSDIMIQKTAFPNKAIKDKTFYDLYDMPTYEELLIKQKEFIKWLEDEIESCELTSDLIFSHNKEIKIYKEILQKYKEIMNGGKE